MIFVEICVGSSCHVKGSNQVISILKEMIKHHQWEDKVILKGAFCMQQCQSGLGIKINGNLIEGIGIHNAKETLTEIIIKEIAND